MTPVLADITEPIPLILTDSEYPTGVLLSPVFVEGGARRRRLVARWGCLAAAACLAYGVMLGVSLTASPVSKPRTATRPTPSVTGAGAPPISTPRLARPPAATRAAVDSDAAQDEPLVLRLALPVTSRSAPPNVTTTTGPAHTTRPRRDDDNPQTTHASTIDRTPFPRSTTATSTRKPVTP